MNEAYSAFAAGYDRMMGDVDYDGWANYIDGFLREAGAKSVLECACGTGSLTVRLGRMGYQITGSDLSEDMQVTVGAGCSLTALAKESVQRGLMGLERLCGIPGTVGGAVAMNAGAYGGEIKNVLKRVRCYREGGFVWEDARLGEMGYRKSPYTWPKTIVTAVELQLAPDDGTAADTMADCMRRRREKQPLSLPSAGSTFKRPEGHFAGALIEGCHLKGCTVGGAQVSELHAGFIVNRGGATAGDVLSLIQHVQDVVYRETGVTLEPEVKRLEDLLCIF